MGTESVGGEVNAGAGSGDSAQPARVSRGCDIRWRAATGKGGCPYFERGQSQPRAQGAQPTCSRRTVGSHTGHSRRRCAERWPRRRGARQVRKGRSRGHRPRMAQGAATAQGAVIREPTSGVGVMRYGREGEDTPEVGDGVGVSGGGVDTDAAAGGCVVWPSAGGGARSRTPVLVNGSPPPPGGLPWPEPASHRAGSASRTHLSQTS